MGSSISEKRRELSRDQNRSRARRNDMRWRVIGKPIMDPILSYKKMSLHLDQTSLKDGFFISVTV
jgi:hypothetical protein